MDGIVGASVSDYFFDCWKWLDFVTNGGLWFGFFIVANGSGVGKAFARSQ
jgi:hypothetical protein